MMEVLGTRLEIKGHRIHTMYLLAGITAVVTH
jgi:hypothetical protein